MRINPTTLEQLLVPAIDATEAVARERGLTAEQHADYAVEVVFAALARVDAEAPDLAGRVRAALVAA